MTIPVWLFDLAADHLTGKALFEILDRWDAELDVDEPGWFDEVVRVIWGTDGELRNARRVKALEALAAAEHEACWMERCRCRRPQWSPTPDRCGYCIGLLKDGVRWTEVPDDWIGDPTQPERKKAAQQRSNDDVVAELTERPLCPTDTDADRARRAGGRDVAETFAGWEPFVVDPDEIAAGEARIRAFWADRYRPVCSCADGGDIHDGRCQRCGGRSL
jgi:hypothetical protein